MCGAVRIEAVVLGLESVNVSGVAKDSPVELVGVLVGEAVRHKIFELVGGVRVGA